MRSNCSRDIKQETKLPLTFVDRHEYGAIYNLYLVPDVKDTGDLIRVTVEMFTRLCDGGFAVLCCNEEAVPYLLLLMHSAGFCVAATRTQDCFPNHFGPRYASVQDLSR